MTKHLGEYLDYYQKLSAPGYAVLVTGEWGVGKTHQVRQFVKSEDCYYVSLFGVSNSTEAHAAVYAAYAPNLSKLNGFIKDAGEAAQNAGGIISFGGMAADLLGAAMRKNVKPDRTLIFDDIERCGMSLEEMMGVFSTYVEMLKFRVVLIADEDKLKGKHSDFPTVKEKIVGHTTKAIPKTSEAFDAFVGEVEDGAKYFTEKVKADVLEIFNASGCMSLRVLRHIIFDLARLFRCLNEIHLQSAKAMNEIIGLFVSCGIEIRLGRISPQDLKNREHQRRSFDYQRHAAQGKEVNKTPFILAVERYPTIDLGSHILDDQVLEDVYENGFFETDRIIASINRSKYFSNPEDSPAWRIILNFDELEDEVLEKALIAMERQFKGREVTSSGDMLHMFCIKLMMANHGIIEKDIDCVRDECLKYIDDLLEDNRIPPRELEWRWWDSFDRAYCGYGYWIEPDYEGHFKVIWDKIIEARSKALEAQFPQIVDDLLTVLKLDGVEFYRKVCQTPGGENLYALIPIFSRIDPVRFVDAWLAAPRPAWRWVGRALEARLEPYRVQHELASERSWASEVLREIERRRDSLSGFERLRVERIIPNKLRQLEEATDLEK